MNEQKHPIAPLLTVRETAETLRISRSSVYQLIASGVLTRIKIGKSARIAPESVKRLASGEATL